jgi:hypothetical protein
MPADAAPSATAASERFPLAQKPARAYLQRPVRKLFFGPELSHSRERTTGWSDAGVWVKQVVRPCVGGESALCRRNRHAARGAGRSALRARIAWADGAAHRVKISAPRRTSRSGKHPGSPQSTGF